VADERTCGTRQAEDLRADHLMAQKVNVGIIFLAMLGEADAVAYFRRTGVPDDVIDRIVRCPQQRRVRGLPSAIGCQSSSPADSLPGQH
jgi:hypothetical protein